LTLPGTSDVLKLIEVAAGGTYPEGTTKLIAFEGGETYVIAYAGTTIEKI
jgi:hypothetical protein